MKVVKKKLDEGMVLLDVTASTSEVSEVLNMASIQFCNQMHIMPRQDKTPAQAASEQMGIKDLDTVVQTQAVEALIPKALNKQGIIPAYMPEPKPKSMFKRGRTFQFELEVMPKPSFELKSYDPVSITVMPKQDDTAAIDREINNMATTFTTYVATDAHPVGKGDCCKLKIEASKDGEVIDGLTTDGRTYEVGIGLMPEGFDEGIMGMEVGETRSFTFLGPDIDENGNEINEEYECTVTLLEIQKEALPVIDDEWVAANMPMFSTLEELRADIAKKVGVQTSVQYDDYVRNLAASELAKRFEGKIDDRIYEGCMRELLQRTRNQVAQAGMTWDKFVEQQGGEQQFSMMMMMETRQQLVNGFALDALYRHEKLAYGEDDLDDVCRSMNPNNPKMVRKQMEAGGYGYALRESAERLCAAKFLVEHADIRKSADAPSEAASESVEAEADGE